jgi:DNA repair exonuclease SbcCD nuclease subunit
MKRHKKNFKKADLILCADIHIHESSPICRLDDFVEETQWRKLDFLSNLQKLHGCPVLHSGDLFEFWKPSPELLSKTIEHLPKQFFTVYGNHDLPHHNLENAYKSGVHTLERAKAVEVLQTCHLNQEPEGCSWQGQFSEDIERKVLIWHVMTFKSKNPFPGNKSPRAAGLLRKYPQYDLIVTGDNHKPFVQEKDGRLLVNPGSLFRTTAAQVEHEPRVYLWYGKENKVEPVFLPIENDVISREHLEAQQDRENRIEAFISTLNEEWELSMSFEDNLEAFKKNNTVRKSVMDIIYKALDNET